MPGASQRSAPLPSRTEPFSEPQAGHGLADTFADDPEVLVSCAEHLVMAPELALIEARRMASGPRADFVKQLLLAALDVK